MAKFANSSPARPTGPLATSGARGSAITGNGGAGYAKDARTELFTLAVSDFGGEDTYYESGDARLARFATGTAAVLSTPDGAEWVAGFAKWLRQEANMRSASIIVACEYVKAGGANGRSVIDSVCVRADEPAEVLGYWLAKYGRKIPMPVKRGVADAAKRLYTERNLLKYDSSRTGVRFADVIELTHPKPKNDNQSQLFKYAIDRRHNRDGSETSLLSLVTATSAIERVSEGERRNMLRRADKINGHSLDDIMTWERLSGWLPGGMDAEAWEAVIPSMGYMALLRNLRNFEQAKISKASRDLVIARLSDPAEVARSRQLPFRFWSAYRELDQIGSLAYAPAIEQALELSCANIPTFTGRTLVAIDSSGSMMSTPSARSKVPMMEIGAVFGAALAVKNAGQVDLIHYADSGVKLDIKSTVLATVRNAVAQNGKVGWGTNSWPSVNSFYKSHDRVVVITDMQDNPTHHEVPNAKNVWVWDLRGYTASNIETGSGRYLLGGFSDKTFQVMSLIEAGRNAKWPWE